MPVALSGFASSIIAFCPRKTFGGIAQKCYDTGKVVKKLIISKIS